MGFNGKSSESAGNEHAAHGDGEKTNVGHENGDGHAGKG